MEDGLHLGIDVACAKTKVLPVAALSRRAERLSLAPLRQVPNPPKGPGNLVIARDEPALHHYIKRTVEWLKELERFHGQKIVRIAIDGPSFPSSETGMRDSEKHLMAEGISFIKTPSQSYFESKTGQVSALAGSQLVESRLPGANIWWMRVGFLLFEALESAGMRCIETYPQAILRKTGYTGGHKRRCVADQLTHLITISKIAGLSSSRLREAFFGSPNDRVDALMAAWVASLPPDKLYHFGKHQDDQICVPLITR